MQIRSAFRPSEQELFHFFVRRLFAARIAEFLCFQTLAVLLLVLRRRIIAVFAFAALQCNRLAHRFPALVNQALSSDLPGTHIHG